MKRIKPKTKKWSRKTAVVTAVLLFIVGLLIGLSVIVLVPFFNHKVDLLNMAQDRGEYSLTNFADYPHPTFGAGYYLLREGGPVVITDNAYLSDTSFENLKTTLPTLLEKGELYTFRIYSFGNMDQRQGTVPCIIAARVVTGRAGIRFGSYIIRDLNDIKISIETFIGIYAILFITALVLIMYISSQHRKLMTIQRDLFSNVSHELKTPITSIKLIAEMINDGMYENEEELKNHASSILMSTDTLDELVKEILELARLQNNKVELRHEKCSAMDVLVPVVDRFKMMSSDFGVELLDSEFTPEGIPALYTDPKYIAKVLSILLENAIKFTGEGGKVAVSSRIRNDQVIICVSDNGPGIDEQHIDRIFERFYMVDETHNSNGSGLGLSIAAETIRGLGEKIWVHSTKGVGTQFYFTIRLK